MRSGTFRGVAVFGWRCTLVAAAVCVQMSLSGVSAQERRLVRVEEDWMALITETDWESSSPQIINAMSPSGSLSGGYGMIEMNHTTAPSFQPGGIQLQARRDDVLTAHSTYGSGVSLGCDYDRLEYTVSLSVGGDGLVLGLSNVRSKTWGSLNLEGMQLAIPQSGNSLEQYSPEVSAASAGVNVGAQRVAVLCQKETRYIYSDGDVVVDPTLRLAERYRDATEPIVLTDYASELSE